MIIIWVLIAVLGFAAYYYFWYEDPAKMKANRENVLRETKSLINFLNAKLTDLADQEADGLERFQSSVERFNSEHDYMSELLEKAPSQFDNKKLQTLLDDVKAEIGLFEESYKQYLDRKYNRLDTKP